MKIGFVSDAHGNPVGLSNCIEFLHKQEVDKIYFMGDAVGYLPRWSEVLKLLSDNNVNCLLGNHDEMMLQKSYPKGRAAIYKFMPEYVASIDSYLDWMRSWSAQMNVEFNGKKILLVHGSPIDPQNGYIYPWDDISSFESLDADCIIMGHTHRPFVRHVAGKLVVNVGSSGLPRDAGNLSSCGILYVESCKFDIFRLPFDVNCILKDIDEIHPSVIECLHRRGDFFGHVVNL